MRDLDFILIGVQKGGTTSLWQYLRRHPQIAMPDFKEAPLFCLDPEQIPEMYERLMRLSFSHAPPEAKLGKAAAHYMMGMKGVGVEEVAKRIATALPNVRLIALLRDPIERAASHYRMSVRRGLESRSFDAAVEELLEPDWLAQGRVRPNETNSYLVQGEYGRVLQCYRSRFPEKQVHVEMTAELDRDPAAAVDRIVGFLGLPTGHSLDGLDIRHHRGGNRKRVDGEGEEQLRDFLAEQVWPELGEERERVEMAFDFFLETWNVIPDDLRPALSESNRKRLEAHYADDAELLAQLGIAAPWLEEFAQG